jgi:hypothetical protein
VWSAVARFQTPAFPAKGNFAIQVEGQEVFIARPIFIVPGHSQWVVFI